MLGLVMILVIGVLAIVALLVVFLRSREVVVTDGFRTNLRPAYRPAPVYRPAAPPPVQERVYFYGGVGPAQYPYYYCDGYYYNTMGMLIADSILLGMLASSYDNQANHIQDQVVINNIIERNDPVVDSSGNYAVNPLADYRLGITSVDSDGNVTSFDDTYSSNGDVASFSDSQADSSSVSAPDSSPSTSSGWSDSSSSSDSGSFWSSDSSSSSDSGSSWSSDSSSSSDSGSSWSSDSSSSDSSSYDSGSSGGC